MATLIDQLKPLREHGAPGKTVGIADADVVRFGATDADLRETFAVTNPATGEHVAEVPRMGAAETERAVAAADAAWPAWRRLTAKERGALLIKVGMTMYDSFSRDGGSVPRHKFLGRKKALAEMPHLNKSLKYTGTYYDASVHEPERLALDVDRRGGVAGVALALLLGWLASLALAGFSAVPPLWAVVAGLVTSLAVGVVAGYLPARRAAALNPVDALRYE